MPAAKRVRSADSVTSSIMLPVVAWLFRDNVERTSMEAIRHDYDMFQKKVAVYGAASGRKVEKGVDLDA